MGEVSHRRVLIRTRPLGKGNYGGILQAYALQAAVRSVGWLPVTDTSTGVVAPAGGNSLEKGSAKARLRQVLELADLPGLTRRRWVADSLRVQRDQQLSRFISDWIATVELYDSEGNARPEVLDEFDGFITGSDQVWRGAYGRIPSYLFDFLGKSDKRPRIAYAASFGTDDLTEYPGSLIKVTKPLARRLDSVSVREGSGVEMARKMWGINATHVLDPTLLLPARQYRSLLQDRAEGVTEGALVSYILDPNRYTRRLAARLESELGISQTSLLPEAPRTRRAYRRGPERYARPSVEQWLASIASASFVLTDSFHGTVFALMFNRPFLTVVNTERGAARFESVLALVGLTSRLISRCNEVDPALIAGSIDWSSVNERIEQARRHSMRFLDAALAQ